MNTSSSTLNDLFSTNFNYLTSKIKFISFLLVLTASLLPAYRINAQQSLAIETIQLGGVGEFNSLALDTDGYAHISYQYNNNLYYAHWNGTSWEIQLVDGSPSTGLYNSIALDSEQRPHIAYYEDLNDDLKYAYWNGSQWMITTIQNTGNVGSYCQLKLDIEDNPHLCYLESDNKLVYTKLTQTGWSITTIASVPSISFVSFVLDKFEHPHISYQHASGITYYLKYAYWDGNNLTVEEIEHGLYSRVPAIALDSNLNPHLAFGGRQNALKYAVKLNGSWQTETLDVGGRFMGYPSILIDNNNYPHIAYGRAFNVGDKDLRYAYQDLLGWHFSTYSPTNGDIFNTILAFDCMEKPYISFFNDVSGGALKFAHPTTYGPDPFSLISPTNGSYSVDKPIFKWELSSYQGVGLDNYELHIDGEFVKSIPATRCFTSIDTALADGIHTWRIKAVLSEGGQIWSTETWSIQIDKTPPQSFNLLSPDDGSWTASNRPYFGWQSSYDAGSGLKNYRLYIDNLLNNDKISPDSTSSFSLFNLADGDHVWYVVAEDEAGNLKSSNQTWMIRIDTTPPSSFTLISPLNSTWTSDTTPTFSWQSSSDAGSDLFMYQLVVDGSVLVDSISADSTNITPDENKALSQGNHTWQIRAFDSVNNIRSTTTWTIRIDVTPPQTFSLSSPADSLAVTIPTPIFSWAPAQDLESGISHYELWIDSVLSVGGLTDTSTAPGIPLTQGIHSWFVNAFDNVGNRRQSSEIRTLIWDPTSPSAFELALPPDGDTVTVGRPEFSWHPSTDPGSGIARYELWINGQLSRIISGKDTSSTPLSSLSNGVYNWFVKAFDFANNTTSSTSVWQFIIDRDTSFSTPGIIRVPRDAPTIQAGIDLAQEGDTVLVDPGIYIESLFIDSKNIVLGSLFLMTGDTSIIDSTIIRSAADTATLSISNGVDSTALITGFYITGNINLSSRGGIICNDAGPTIFHNIISENTTPQSGGGICLNNNSNAVILYNNILYNSSLDSPGGGGGGIACFNSNPRIENNYINNNNTGGKGGGIYIYESRVVVSDNVISENESFRGAAIYCDRNSDVTINNNTITQNFASDAGGGIYCDFVSPQINNNHISKNMSVWGGGVFCRSASPLITGNFFTEDSASGSGGAVYLMYESNANILKNIFYANWAPTAGAINCNAIEASINNNTFHENISSTGGSILEFSSIADTIYNNIFYKNTGVAISCAGTYIQYSDFYENSGGNFIQNPPTGIGIISSLNINGDSCDTYYNIYEDPLFVNAAIQDYYLAEKSPCIDAGNPANMSDPDGTISDIGALYYDQLRPIIISSDSLLNFGTVDIGQSKELSLLLHNSGSALLRIGDIINYNSVYTHNWEKTDSLISPGESREIIITFTPLDTILSVDTLKIESNASSLWIYLSGKGGIVDGLSENETLPKFYALYPAYPNPFNSSVRIKFDLPKSAIVNLIIYNIIGEKVEVLVQERLSAGSYTRQWNANNLASGIYLYRFQVAEFVQTKKMILLR